MYPKLELEDGKVLVVVSGIGGEGGCLLCVCEERLFLGFEVKYGYEGSGVVFKPNVKGGEFLPLTKLAMGETPDEVAGKLALLADEEGK